MNKILLVTGASSDVGGALIRRVAGNYDAILAHFGRSVDKINALAAEFGAKIVPLKADFANPDDVERLAAEVINRELMPFHFVHLPAIPNVNAKFPKTAWTEYEAQLAVQLQSAHILCREFVPIMARRKYGKLVFMLTENTAKQVPGKYAVPYTTAKYALLGFMKCLAAEYAEKGITVNGVSPCMVETAFVSALPELARNLNANNSPIKRNLTVADVVPTIEFLLSPGSDAITGQNIAILGGN